MDPSARRPSRLPTIRLDSIEASADPRWDHLLGPYRNQKDAWLRVCKRGGRGIEQPAGLRGRACPDGLFLAEGKLVVEMLIDSPTCSVESVLCTPRRCEEMAPVLARLDPSIPIFVAPRSVLASIVGFDLHRGVLAAGMRRIVPEASSLIAGARTLVLCEDLSNHDNTGAIFRNVAAMAGARRAAVLLSPGCCDPLYRKSIRVSMGHVLRVPFATLDPWLEGLDSIARAGFQLCALTPDPSACALDALARTRRPGRDANLALLVGAEGSGLSDAALKRVSTHVRIAMEPGTDSLNVATALAIALSHLVTPIE